MFQRKQSKGELDRSPRAVASPNQTFVPFASIPAGEYTRGRSRGDGEGRGCSLAPRPSSLAPAVQQEVDRCIRSLLAQGFQPACTYRPTQLGQRLGTSVRTIGSTLPADGSVHRTSRSDAAGAGRTQRLMDTLSVPPSVSVACVSSDRCFCCSLSPCLRVSLSVVAQDSALRTQDYRCCCSLSPCLRVSLSVVHQQAFARLQAQKIAQQRYTYDRIAQKRKEVSKREQRSGLPLEERIRRIYGIDMPNPHSVVKGAPSP